MRSVSSFIEDLVAPSGMDLFRQLVVREIRGKFQNVPTTVFWLFINPLALLSIYAVVFELIFDARVPGEIGVPFFAWLAIVLWPWLAFSDSILRGAQAIRQHGNLISKVSLPRIILVCSTHTAAFLLHLFGFAIVLLILYISGIDLSLIGLPYLILLMAALYGFALGIALLLAGVTVFIPDLEQMLPTLFTFWFFLTPILYSVSMLPSELVTWINLNPLTWFAEEIRSALVGGQWVPGEAYLSLLVWTMFSLAIGVFVFNKLAPHFQDYL